jgi:hypothetical protein
MPSFLNSWFGVRLSTELLIVCGSSIELWLQSWVGFSSGRGIPQLSIHSYLSACVPPDVRNVHFAFVTTNELSAGPDVVVLRGRRLGPDNLNRVAGFFRRGSIRKPT